MAPRSASGLERGGAGCRAIASAPSSPTSSSGLSVPLAARSRIGWRPVDVQGGVERDHGRLAAERALGQRDHRQRAALAQVARGRERLARGVRMQAVEAVDRHERVPAAGGDALGGVDRPLDRLILERRRRRRS